MQCNPQVQCLRRQLDPDESYSGEEFLIDHTRLEDLHDLVHNTWTWEINIAYIIAWGAVARFILRSKGTSSYF